jgi:hypothetical protein
MGLIAFFDATLMSVLAVFTRIGFAPTPVKLQFLLCGVFLLFDTLLPNVIGWIAGKRRRRYAHTEQKGHSNRKRTYDSP